jgi:intein-encoded DNA endonuclease-like protein
VAYDMTNDEIVEAAARLTPQYLAGFFDGEGCVCVSKSSNVLSIRVSISQAEPKILALVAFKFGMSLSVNRLPNRYVYSANLGGRSVIPFLEYIKDHVICKRRQVIAALEFTSTIRSHGGFTLSVEETTTRKQLAEVIKQANNGIDTSLEVLKNNG